MTISEKSSGTGSWAELLGRRHLGATVVLAGGVALYAINVYVTISLLPTAVREIGGERLYAWNTTVFLLASVASAVLVGSLLAAAGSRGAYLLALALFLAGTLVCAAAPTMAVLLVGRAVQGAGGGLLAGLGYALIRAALPAPLWTRASALVSAMWGVGTFVGPALGGAFAEFSSWRGAFVALAVAAVLVGAVVPKALAGARTEAAAEPFPLVALVLLASAALVVSVASVIATPVVGVVGVLLGLALIAAFIAYERRAPVRVLPAATYRGPSRLRWIYATLALLAMSSMVEAFIPLFGQRLAGLAPLAAGFLGAAVALGWTAGELPSASAARAVTIRRIIIAGPVVVGVGLLLAAVTVRAEPGGWLLAVWVLAFLITGAGTGIAWPHLSTAAMSSVADPAEGNKASAAINTVQLVANAFAAALTGLMVNLGEPDMVTSARYLFGSFALLGVLGLAAAVLSQRAQGQRRPATPPPA